MDLEQKRTWLKGLLIGCPFEEPLDECPARELRTLPFDRQMKAVDDLPEKEVDGLLSSHRECLRRREALH